MSISLANIFELEKKNIEHFITNVLLKVVNDEDDHTREKMTFYSHVKNIFCFLGENVRHLALVLLSALFLIMKICALSTV